MAKTSFLEEVTFNCINQFFDSLKKLMKSAQTDDVIIFYLKPTSTRLF